MPNHAYLDFDLLIESSGQGGYRARVLKSPVGEAPPTPIVMPFSDLELENFLLKIGRPRQRTSRGMQSTDVATAREFGSRLFDAVFRDHLRRTLASSLDQVEALDDTGLRVRLRLSDCPELADLPWEYLYDSDIRRFLALSEWTPVVRYLDLPGRIRPLTIEPPLRILLMAASPTDLDALDVQAEWDKVREALEGLSRDGRVQLHRVPTGRLADLRRELRQGAYHVFHFIGHGRYDSDAGDGVLALEDSQGRTHPVTGTDLGMLLHDHRSLRLVVLNSCEGARAGVSDSYSGTAQSLVYQTIPAVVAMQFEITDHAAITFAHTLYEAVAEGYPLDAAMAEGRNAVRDDSNPLEWATPVLYLRAPDGRIFDVPAGRAPAGEWTPEAAREESSTEQGIGADEDVPRTGPSRTPPSSPFEPAAGEGSPTEWVATPKRVNITAWRSDWRVDIRLTTEEHSIEYRDLSMRKAVLLIDGAVATDITSFVSPGAIGAQAYRLSDGDATRSLQLRGSWLSATEELGDLEFWVDETLLLRLDLAYKWKKEDRESQQVTGDEVPSDPVQGRKAATGQEAANSGTGGGPGAGGECRHDSGRGQSSVTARLTGIQGQFKTVWTVELTRGSKSYALRFDHYKDNKLRAFVDDRLQAEERVFGTIDRKSTVKLQLDGPPRSTLVEATVNCTWTTGRITHVVLAVDGVALLVQEDPT